MSDSTKPAADSKVKPEKPDEAKFKADLAVAEKEFEAAKTKLNAVKEKLELTKSNNKDSPAGQKEKALRDELASIRQKQSGFKTSRGSTQEKISALDATLKARIAEQKNARSKVSYKNTDEIDREISRLRAQVDAGTMKIVDENKNLSEIERLTRQKKNFAGFDDAEKNITSLKNQIAELKKTLDNAEAKALSDRYTAITKELDGFHSERQSANKNRQSLYDERNALQKEQQTKFTAIRELKDTYYQGKKAFKAWEDEAYKARRDRQKAERESYEKEKRRKVIVEKLDDAKAPAFSEEINVAVGLIRHFDPSVDLSTLEVKKAAERDSSLTATAQRKVDDSGLKGMKVLKKQEEEYFMGGSGGKKGKKSGKKADSGKFQLSTGVIEQLSQLKLDAPMTQDDVPALVEELKKKVIHWRTVQDETTKANIAKVEKELAKFDAGEHETSPSATNGASNGTEVGSAKKIALVNEATDNKISAEAELKQEEDAAADVAKELEEAKIEDAQQ